MRLVYENGVKLIDANALIKFIQKAPYARNIYEKEWSEAELISLLEWAPAVETELEIDGYEVKKWCEAHGYELVLKEEGA